MSVAAKQKQIQGSAVTGEVCVLCLPLRSADRFPKATAKATEAPNQEVQTRAPHETPVLRGNTK
jgi:hypothetical protein